MYQVFWRGGNEGKNKTWWRKSVSCLIKNSQARLLLQTPRLSLYCCSLNQTVWSRKPWEAECGRNWWGKRAWWTDRVGWAVTISEKPTGRGSLSPWALEARLPAAPKPEPCWRPATPAVSMNDLALRSFWPPLGQNQSLTRMWSIGWLGEVTILAKRKNR